MKRVLLIIAVLGLLFACTPENNGNNGGGGQNNEEELTITGEALDVTGYSATLTGYANLPFELGDAEVGIMYDKVQSFESAKKVVATGLDGNNKFTVSATGLEPSTTYYYKSYVQNGMAFKYGAVKTFTTQEAKCPAGAVDLGIVMTREDGTTYNLYWAKSNLSDKGLCTNPEDYGDYYAWGEIDPYYSSQDPLTWKDGKTGYNWASYKWCNGSPSTLTKYNTKSSYYGTVDNKAVLESSDDVASVKKLGGKWRMPTEAEWTELVIKCIWTWTTNYNGTGVKGRIVAASNGNSIFLPAAGGWYGTRLSGVGSDGVYCSSSLYTDNPSYAWLVDFGSDNVLRGYGYRCYGQSVRPVYDDSSTGSEEPITVSIVNYYGCKMSSSTVSSSAHVDINIYGTNVLGQSIGWGISTLKKTWASATCYVNGTSYNLEATDGASFTTSPSQSQYGSFYWTWAFENTTVMSALMNASKTNPVTIKMTDVHGKEYSFVYSEPQTTNSSFYKY